MREIVWVTALICAMGAGLCDWRSRIIPNWLTVSSLLIGLVLNVVGWGWKGLGASLAGALVALLLLLPLVLLRSLGAGDWKLMGALGAFLGPKQILFVLFGTIFVTGIMAAAQVIWRRRVAKTLDNMGELMRATFTFGFKPHPRITLDNPDAPNLPFGVAVAVTMLIGCWLVRAGV
jgi:prepilin peptidase CpaA